MPANDPSVRQASLSAKAGVFMYPRSAPTELLRMIVSGASDLWPVKIEAFPLTEIGNALDAAAGMKGLHYCVVLP
jgi:hypothetical protein